MSRIDKALAREPLFVLVSDIHDAVQCGDIPTDDLLIAYYKDIVLAGAAAPEALSVASTCRADRRRGNETYHTTRVEFLTEHHDLRPTLYLILFPNGTVTHEVADII